MAIPQSEQRILQQKSGNRCAFPTCRRRLTAASTPDNREVVLGEMAHIIGESVNGPRGNSPLSLTERNQVDNLILLCNTHHQLIDSQPETYPVAVLRRMKQEHEEWVEATLGRGLNEPYEAPSYSTETLHSTLLPVERMPFYLYSAPCSLSDDEVGRQLAPLRKGEAAPFFIRANTLFVFQDLREPDNPFHRIAPPDGQHDRHLIATWVQDPTHYQWFAALLNRLLNKLTGRRQLFLDRRHQRYYFRADAAEQEVEIEYQPLNQQRTSRKVVWQPINKRTGEGRGFWFHRAVALHFHRIGDNQWCLSLRPELRVTLDGIQPLPSEDVGRRVTKKKSRMFNYDLLGEVQFWRDYLSGSSPRIILSFGPNQSMIIANKLMQGVVEWPGIPSEHAKPFKNVEYVDDLFSWAELQAADGDEAPAEDEEPDEELDEAEEDDLFDEEE